MKKAINQSLLTLILNGVSIVALLFMVLSILSFSRVSNQVNKANEERYELTYNANRFMNGSSYLTNEVRAFAATGEQQHYDNYWNEVNNLKNRDHGVEAMQEVGITSEEQAMIDDMSTLSNKLVPLEEEAMREVQNGETEKAIDYVYGSQYSQEITKINSIKEQFLDTLNDRTSKEVNKLVDKAKKIEVRIIIAVIIVGFMQLFNMITIRWRVLHPVIAVKDQMGEISQGNLSMDFPLKSDTSEIGMLVESIHETKRELKKYIDDIDFKLAEMAEGNMDITIGSDYRGEFMPIQNAMRQILDGLNNALLKINVSAEQVSEESNAMASGAQVLSDGAVKQSAAVQQLTAGIHEISEQVSSTSKDADNARKYSSDAAMQLSICDQKMGELTSAIQSISDASSQIGGIIKTIEDISFQTNILALNASVEAARAGEAGKGFAVVANEVQTLANKSADSAKDITDLIENSINLVKHGSVLSADATNTLSEAVSTTNKTAEMVEHIAESANQQVQSIEQLSLGMDQIADVVQTNASTAERTAASAIELQNQAEELKISVHKFKLRRR